MQITDLFGTGAATQTSLVATGAADPHYTITDFTPMPGVSGTQAPYGAYPPADPSVFTGAPKAYRIDDWTPNNTSGDRVSQWVAPPNSYTSTATIFSPDNQFVIAPVGVYSYETTFTLPASFTNITKIFISGSIRGDNLTPAIRLNPSGTNTNNIPGYAGGASFSYESTDPFNSLFVTGVNTMVFRVRNTFVDPLDPSDFYNPTGLQVTITGAYYETSSVVPEIDPAGFSAVFSLVVGSLGLLERRRAAGRHRRGA